MPLSGITITTYATSEVVRLCLRKRDMSTEEDDKDSITSDDSTEEETEVVCYRIENWACLISSAEKNVICYICNISPHWLSHPV